MMGFILLLQALPYVCLLIAMLFFIFAIIGMQVITQTRWTRMELGKRGSHVRGICLFSAGVWEHQAG